MISKEALRTFTKRIAENTNLISFCNKVIAYNDILNNEEDRIYIRNHPKETDFVVWKENCESTDWWD